ncbi:uncharacterized protein LOC118691648 isoform X2 [Molothrus ater]|uniref:uncharacterized protein LOC118691648 isoform X2 n=1 Tax=Molothrus ater TaxID=84834 RepID=UPI0023E8DC76|nr:uncharacterized protein LOC118691648 isoform X2 [Molothrus ater]
MKEMLKKIRQRGQEMKGEPVLKAEFPAGSSDSVPASAAGREAMPGPVPGDEVAGKASPFDWLNKVLKPLEPPAGASAGRTFQAPLLVPAHKPSSHRRGPPRGKNKPRGEKKSLESNDIWKQIVEELHKGNDWDPEMDYLEVLAHNHFKSLEDAEAKPAGEGDAASQPMSRTELLGSMTEPLGDVMDQKAGQKEVFPQGSRGQLAAPAAVRKAKTDTGTGTGTGGNCCAGLIPWQGCVAAALPPGPALAWPGSSQSWRCLWRIGGLWSSFTAPGKGDSCTNVPPAAAAPEPALSAQRPKAQEQPRAGALPRAQGQSQPWLPTGQGLHWVLTGPDSVPWGWGSCHGAGRARAGTGCSGMGLARVPPSSDCPSSCAAPGLPSRPAGLCWVAQPVPRGGKVPAGPSSGGNGERPACMHRAARSAVQHSTGSPSPLLAQVQPAPPHVFLIPRRGSEGVSVRELTVC